MQLVKVAYKSLIPYANNPRNIEDAIPAVEESIEQVGYITPIIVDENNVILAGHTRYMALYNLAMDDEVEVLKVEGLTEEQKKKFRLLDNKTAEFAEWNLEMLMQEIEGMELGGFDWFEKEIEQAADNMVKEKSTKEKEEKVQKPVICPRCGKVIKGGGSDMDVFVGNNE